MVTKALRKSRNSIMYSLFFLCIDKYK
jgi:hypothetical protein